MFLEQQISILEMISEGSCDTEDWSNDAESLGINYILKYITITNYTILPFYCFFFKWMQSFEYSRFI